MNGHESLKLLRISEIGDSRATPVVAVAIVDQVPEDELKNSIIPRCSHSGTYIMAETAHNRHEKWKKTETLLLQSIWEHWIIGGYHAPRQIARRGQVGSVGRSFLSLYIFNFPTCVGCRAIMYACRYGCRDLYRCLRLPRHLSAVAVG